MDFRGARSGCHRHVTEIKAVVFNFFIYLLIILPALVVLLVSVVSFPLFRFVVLGFSTYHENETS